MARALSPGFLVATALGICAYTMIFVLLSVATSRPLVFGLGYVFIWEGLLGDLFTGTRYLSVRQYCLGIADGITTVSERVFQAELNARRRARSDARRDRRRDGNGDALARAL